MCRRHWFVAEQSDFGLDFERTDREDVEPERIGRQPRKVAVAFRVARAGLWRFGPVTIVPTRQNVRVERVGREREASMVLEAVAILFACESASELSGTLYIHSG